jgi:ferredoxin-NADP reductase
MPTLLPPKQYTAKLSDKTVYNPKFERYAFELVEPNKLDFSAGQYVSFAITDEGHRRSWSIASSPEVDHGFELLIDPAPMGIGTKYLQNLKLGDEVKLLAPLGRFVVDDSGAEQAIDFVATGVGITPFRAMILDLLQLKQDKREITLHWGLRHVEEMIWEDEFQELAENYKNFHFHPVISQAPPEWPLCRGHVTDCLSIHELPANAGYYLCGRETMIQDVTNLLTSKGVAPERIHREKFY